MQAHLIRKTSITDTVIELEFELPQPVDFRPGQFARLDIGSGDWRDYTIIDLHERRVRFLVDTGTGGQGPRFADQLQPGAAVDMDIPKGDFVLGDSDSRKVMVATGTGLAPFIAMVTDAVRRWLPLSIDVIFGCRRQADDLTTRYLPQRSDSPRVAVEVFLSAEPGRDGYRAGYVTEALARECKAPEHTEYYVCGNAGMVEDVTALLTNRGARHIFTEPY